MEDVNYRLIFTLYTTTVLSIIINHRDLLMGALTGRDSNVTLYMNVNKQYYIAGEYVEGEIYLDVKTDRQYSNLCIKLDGDEQITWTEQHHKTTVVYTNSYENYRGHILIVDFHGTVQKGQYSFPFKFLLPAMMTGSFYMNRFCHLKYMLKAQLVHPTSERQTQEFSMFLNILEPPRMPMSQISFTNSEESKCCGCCMSYGTTTVALSCDKNFVRSGDTIKVKGLIDNTFGKNRINSAKVVFEQWLFEIASNEYSTHYTNEKDFTLHQVTAPTGAGQVQEFSFTATIPNEIIDCTAIGRIVARYFILHLYTSYGCCANTAESVLHLIVHSKSPVVVEKKTLPPPSVWNPKVYPQVLCENMKPYVYSPLPQIPFLNMPGDTTVKTNLNFDKQMNEMQRNVSYQLGKEIIFDKNISYNYQPQFYGQDNFSEEQRIQQGYQPYFNQSQESNESLMVMKKK